MRKKTFSASAPASLLTVVLACVPATLLASPPGGSEVELKGLRWQLGGKLTNPGSVAEGLLLNVRMVQATFEDRNSKTRPEGFDPEKNTDAFIAKIPEYVASGINAFTLCLQGGDAGYEGALNSAYDAKGALRADYMKRVARVIEACDRAGVAVILGLFHSSQDQVLEDADAVQAAVLNATRWLVDKGYSNVLLEIASEFPDKAYDHWIISNPLELRSLIRIARKTAPGLLISASGAGGGRVPMAVVNESDFLALHFSAIDADTIYLRVATMSKVSKPLLCNLDAKTGEEGAASLEAAAYSSCSWGYANIEVNEHYPFEFKGAADDPVVYAKFKELAGR